LEALLLRNTEKTMTLLTGVSKGEALLTGVSRKRRTKSAPSTRECEEAKVLYLGVKKQKALHSEV
jgi:hypothetical protein